MTHYSYKNDTTELPPGKWRLDPRTRTLKYVPDDPDAFEKLQAEEERREAHARMVRSRRADKSRHRPKPCPHCPAFIHHQSEMCIDCHRVKRRAEATHPPAEMSDYEHGPIDPSAVEAVLAGRRVWCNKASRFEVIRRWHETGNSWVELERIAGWNVSRHKRQMNGEIDRRLAA